jgi:hypothetical protein
VIDGGCVVLHPAQFRMLRKSALGLGSGSVSR